MSTLPRVVIVGRMNVGKSTLFNRLSVNVKSMILDYEGVTRDFLQDRIEWAGKTFDLVDSGGIHLRKTEDPLFEKVREQVLKQIETADLILFVVDGTQGILPEDREIARYIHKLKKPLLLVINKSDSKETAEHEYEFEALGISDRLLISAQHGRGIDDLLAYITSHLPERSQQGDTEPTFKVVFLGKPNVGKSSLMNALLQEERSIVSEIPGTTREALSEKIMFYKEPIILTDTPGIRRKRSISGELEPMMVKSSFQALKDADIVVLMLDGSEEPLVDQELKLAFYAYQEHHKALVILINKNDLTTDLIKQELERRFDLYKHLIERVPVLHISCKTGKNIGKVLPLLAEVWHNYKQEFGNAALTKIIIGGLHKKPLYHKTKLLSVYGVKQIRTAPPTIELLVNEPQWFEETQLGFFENLLRDEYDLTGISVKFVVRKKKE